MLKLVVISVLALSCSARPYGQTYSAPTYGGASYGQTFVAQPQKVQLTGFQGGSYGTSFGGYGGYGQGLALNAGYGQGLAVNSGFGQGQGLALNSGFRTASGLSQNNHFGLLNARQGQQFEPTVTAAIHQVGRTVEYRPIANQEQPIQPQVIEIEPSDNPVHLHFKTRSSTLSVSQSHTPAEAQQVQTASEQDAPQRLLIEVQKPVIQEVREFITPTRNVVQEIHPVVESLHQIVSKGQGQRAQYTGAQYGGSQYGAVAQSAQTAYISQPAVQSSYIAKPAFSATSLQTSYPSSQSSSLLVNPVASVQSGYSNTASDASTSEY